MNKLTKTISMLAVCALFSLTATETMAQRAGGSGYKSPTTVKTMTEKQVIRTVRKAAVREKISQAQARGEVISFARAKQIFTEVNSQLGLKSIRLMENPREFQIEGKEAKIRDVAQLAKEISTQKGTEFLTSDASLRQAYREKKMNPEEILPCK